MPSDDVRVEQRPTASGKIGPWRGYRRHSRIAATADALVLTDHRGHDHVLPVPPRGARSDSDPSHLYTTLTSHVSRGGAWREPLLLVASRDHTVLAQMRIDGYDVAGIEAVATALHLNCSDRWFLSTREREAELPTPPAAVRLDVTTTATKLVVVVALIVVTLVVLAGLVALVER